MGAARLGLAVRLAGRELRSGLRGFGVFLGCLWLGVFAIAAVGAVSAAARQGILADARGILGGDLELSLTHRPAAQEVLAQLASWGRTSTVLEVRAMARPSAAPGDATGPGPVLVEVKAVDAAYPLHGTLELVPPMPLPAALETRGGRAGAVVDPRLLERLGLSVGDLLVLGEAALEVRAELRREPDRALTPFSLGPRVIVSPDTLEAAGLLVPGSLVRYRHRLVLAGDSDPEERLQALDARFPEGGWRGRTFLQAAPRVRRLLERMTVQLTLVALFTLLVGGLGVGGAVRGYLDGKLRHLAVLKCVGASEGDVFRVYLLQILALGAVAATMGAAAGGAVPGLLRMLWGAALPFPLEPGAYLRPLLAGTGFGLLVALVFSLGALGSAARVSPSSLFRGGDEPASGTPGKARRRVLLYRGVAAGALGAAVIFLTGDPRLSGWFLLGTAGCFGLFHLLGRALVETVRRLPRPHFAPLRMALSNISRPRSVARSAVLSLGMGLTALAAVALVQHNLQAIVADQLPAQAPGLFFFQILSDQIAGFEVAVGTASPGARVERFPTLRGRITRIAGEPAEERQISPGVGWAVRGDRFLTFAATPRAADQVVAGAWWPRDYGGPPLISLTEDLARGFRVEVGDTLTLNVLGREITGEIVNLRRVDWSTLELNFAIVFSPGVLEAAPLTWMAAVHLPETAEAAVLRRVTEELPNVSAVQVREVLVGVVEVVRRIGAVFRAMAGVTLLTGVLVLAGALSAEQHRRIGEAVVYKVCGATRGDVLAVFGAEFLLVGAAAAAISCATGTAAAWGIVSGLMNLRFTFDPAVLLATVALGVGATAALGLLGTARALRQNVVRHLREE
ncbi:MAG: FtsX-like permease family protein [Deferrisomatales bacterium]|nr:FtsX-like permease family protein [Deferrisomatales bacterium]